MRILYLNPIAQMGGAETSLLELLSSVRAAQPDWQLSMILGAAGPLVAKAEALGISVRVAPIPAALAKLGDSNRSGRTAILLGLCAAFGYVRKLKQIVHAERPQLIHATGFKMHALSAWVRPRQVPVVWHIHDYVESRPVMRRLLRWHAGQCEAIIANSQSVAEELSTAFRGRSADCIYNAVDLGRFSPSGPMLDLDSLSGLPAVRETVIRIGLVATFARWKGHRTFLKALSLLAPEHRVRGYIIGGPVYQTMGSQESLEDLRAEARRLGLNDRVGFTGHLGDTASAMRALDIVVHASTSPEPFGMVIAEGMACGKPVIVSDAGGASELFEDGVDSLGHIPGDASGLAQQIERLARDRALRVRLGQAARRRAKGAFDRQRLAAQVLEVYERLGVSVRHEESVIAAAS